jgi:uncharacterized membrane protein YfcA
MELTMTFALIILGVVMGVLSGVLGVGGGIFIVPALIALGYSPVHAISTSGVPILLSAISAVTTHIRMKTFLLAPALRIGIPALLVAQGGVWLAHLVRPTLLLVLFGSFLLANFWLVRLKKVSKETLMVSVGPKRIVLEVMIGGTGGFLGGFFGLGGGVVMVPLQLVLLNENIKNAARVSIAVVLITALSSVTGHALKGTVLWNVGIAMGVGSILGAQVGTLVAPKMSDTFVKRFFQLLLFFLAVFVFYRAWKSM